MNYAKNCENLLNFVKVIPKTLLVSFFSGHGVVHNLVIINASSDNSSKDVTVLSE